MMDTLEKFVRDHRDEFDVYEPGDGLRKKKVLPEAEIRSWNAWIWKAALLLLVFGASFWAQQKVSIQKPEVAMKQGKTNPELAIPELAEANKYYTTLIQAKLQEVQPVLVKYPEIRKDLKQELAQLDTVYQSLMYDLKDNVSNAEIIDAMIQNYRLKLNLLEQIQMELQGQNTKDKSKKQSHENRKTI